MPDESKDFHGISVRLTVEELEELDTLASELTRRAKGARVTRAGVARIAHNYGIAQLKRELANPQ